MNKKQTINLEPFEVDIKPSKYLLKATADVWYDLTGVFHIYDCQYKQLLFTILIKDNSKKYEEVAKFCYGLIMPSKDFELLTPYSKYESLFKVVDGKVSQIIKATKFIYDDDDKELYYEWGAGFWDVNSGLTKIERIEKYKPVDISHEKLKISDIIERTPSYLRTWPGGWAFDQIFIYDKVNQIFVCEFMEYCPYETEDDSITDKRMDLAFYYNNHSDYILLTGLNPYQDLWLFEDEKYTKLIEPIILKINNENVK